MYFKNIITEYTCYSYYNPYGDVHMFRMSLWAEHLKTWEEQFRFPGTLDCTARVKEMCW